VLVEPGASVVISVYVIKRKDKTLSGPGLTSSFVSWKVKGTPRGGYRRG